MKTTATSNTIKLTATQSKAFLNRWLSNGNKVPQSATVLQVDYDSVWYGDNLVLVPCTITVLQELRVNLQVLELLEQLASIGAATTEQLEQLEKLQQGANGECVCRYNLPIDNVSENIETIVETMKTVNGGVLPYMVG